MLAHKSSPFTFVLPSFIPLLSTQPSSVSLHSFSGLPSSSVLRRVFHHDRKRKKRGDTCCKVRKLCVNPYISIVNLRWPRSTKNAFLKSRFDDVSFNLTFAKIKFTVLFTVAWCGHRSLSAHTDLTRAVSDHSVRSPICSVRSPISLAR